MCVWKRERDSKKERKKKEIDSAKVGTQNGGGGYPYLVTWAPLPLTLLTSVNVHGFSEHLLSLFLSLSLSLSHTHTRFRTLSFTQADEYLHLSHSLFVPATKLVLQLALLKWVWRTLICELLLPLLLCCVVYQPTRYCETRKPNFGASRTVLIVPLLTLGRTLNWQRRSKKHHHLFHCKTVD